MNTAYSKESAAYARGVGESLKGQVYDDHSLIVLYRLLFIFYVEARELLPLRESARYRTRFA